MPNQEITVGLRFTADIGAARQQLNSLKTDLMGLSTIMTTNSFGQTITQGLNQASLAAVKLKTQLDAATNIKTGNLDLTKFTRQLQQSGMTLSQYRTQLSSLGPAGQQAFIQLATSIQNAEIPVIRINKLFSRLWDTLKRTARWQISSTAIHAVMGAVQSAYGYAKDLNESLNNIRIVTGQSSEQMAKFAQNANKAAKALSTTTTAYTDAALIYYQQGLSDQEVLARADTTIKMANVTRQSAETVSDQMTAVWNNFAKGGENLESFADKMVALGAATASSSDEISQGLEKFAGVADTIGLSFDYAAAALTTITATTRMSADTVGTALKTLFSRLESLKLGDSLEDGTDLTKYSEALATVGINIKDSNGELKKMDTVLDETMDKWKTLSKDQQVALAQTVAGQRQYTQFMTLMEQSDFFKKNLQVEAGAKGALQEQADIYAESWEASNKRVKAAVESIYSEIIDDKFFINLNDHLAKIISFVDKLIKSMGGLHGLLSTISTLVFSIGGEAIANRLRDISFSIQTIATKGQNIAGLKEESARQVGLMVNDVTKKPIHPEDNEYIKAQEMSFSRISILQNIIAKNANKISEAELEEYKNLVQIQDLREKENLAIQEKLKNTKLAVAQAENEIELYGSGITKTSLMSREDRIAILQEQRGNLTMTNSSIELRKAQLSKKSDLTEEEQKRLEVLNRQLEINKKIIAELDLQIEKVKEAKQYDTFNLNDQEIDKINEKTGVIEKNLDKEQELEVAIERVAEAQQNFDGTSPGTQENITATEKLTAAKEALRTVLKNLGIENVTTQEAYTRGRTELDKLKKSTDNYVEGLEKVLKELHIEDTIIEGIITRYRNLIDTRRELTKAELRAARGNEAVGASYELLQKRLNTIAPKIKDYSTVIVNAARTVSSFSMGIRSAVSAVQTLKNNDLRSWEKISSIMMSMPMIITGFTTGITGVLKAFSTFNANIHSTIAINKLLEASENDILGAIFSRLEVQSLANAAIDEENLKKSKNLLLQQLQTEDTYENIHNKLVEIIVTNGVVKANDDETKAKMADALATELLKKQTNKLTFAELKEIAAAKLSKTVHALLNPTFLGVAAAAAILTAAIVWQVKAYNKDADAAEQASKASKLAGDAADEAAEKYKKLSDIIENYKTGKDKLNELVSGTQEFKDVLESTNESALELIKTLSGVKYHYGENGLIYFDEKDLENAQRQAKENANRTKANAYNMQTIADEAQRISQRTNFEREGLTGTADDWGTGIGNTAAAGGVGFLGGGALGIAGGAALGAKILGVAGTALGPVGTALGIVLGGAIGAITGTVVGLISGAITEAGTGSSSKKETQALEAVGEVYKKQRDLFAKYQVGTKDYTIEKEKEFAKELEQIDGITSDIAKSMAKNAEQLKEWLDTNEENLQRQKAQIKESLSLELLNNQRYENSDYKDFILASMASNVLNKKSDLYTQHEKENKDKLWFHEKELAEEYLRITYGDDWKGKYKITDKQGTNWTVKKFNENSSKWDIIEEKLSQDAVIKAVSTSQVYKEVLQQQEDFIDKSEKYAKELENFGFKVNKEVEESTTAEAEDEKERMKAIRNEIMAAYAEDREADLTKLTFAEIEQFKNIYNKNKNLISSELRDTLEEGLENADSEKRKINQQASASWAEGIETREKEELQDILNTVEMSTEAFNAYTDSIKKNNAEAKMTTETAQKVAKQTLITSNAIRNISTVLEDNAKVFEELTANQEAYINGTKKLTAEQATVIEELAGSINEWLDTDFSFDEILQNMNIIKAAAENDAEAIRQLGYLAAQKTIMEFDIDEASKKEFYDFINYIDSQDQDLTIGATLEMEGQEEFFKTINKLVQDGQIAAEDVAKAMKQIGYEMTPTGWTDPLPMGEMNGSLSLDVLGISPKIGYTIENKARLPIFGSEGLKYTGGGQTTSLPPLKTGSGKSGGSKKDTTPKKVSEEIDRYHEVNAEIDDLTKKMDELSTLKDRAWGGRRIAAIRAERQALKEYGELLQRKSDEAYEYLQQDASYLNAYGAIYDKEGRLLNSNEIIAQAVADFNVGRIDDEKFNNIKKYISNYESSLEEYQNSLYDIAENLRNQFDKEIEEITATVEIKLEVDDRQIKYIEWLVGHLEDKAFSQAAIISTASQNYDNILNKWDTYTAGIHDILAKAGASEENITNYLNGNVDALLGLDNIDEVIDELEEYTDGLADTYDQLKDLKDLIEQQLSSVYDEWNDKIEYQMGLMEHYDSILSHYRNIIDILGLDFLGLSTKNLIDLSQTQINSSVSMIQTLKSRWNAAQEELKTAQVNLQNATSEADQKFWTEEVEKLTQASNELEENFYSSWEDILNKISDLFDTTRERIFKDFEKSISDAFNSFDEMSSLLDQRKTIAAEYVPEYKKIYELNKLNRNLAKEIDKINDVSKTKKLKDLQDEINAKMREGVQLSEYDLEYMQKKYDLRLAEIALEDAQAAKTTVRLQRDSSGNYSYVYTANEEQTNDKLQDYEDKLYALQDTTENYFNTLSESYFQIMQDWENALGGLDKNDKNYEQKLNKINAFYQKRMQYITSELNKGLKNNQQLYKDDQEYMNIYYTNQENRQRAFILNFKDTLVGGILDGFNSIDEATNYITGQMDNALDQLSIAWTDYYNQTEEALQLNGMSFDDFSGKLEDIIFGENGINAKISSIAETTKEMAESSKEDYNKAANAVESFQQRVGPKLDELFQKTDAFTGALATLQQKLLENYPDPNITVTQTNVTRNVNVNENMTGEEYAAGLGNIYSQFANMFGSISKTANGSNNNTSDDFETYRYCNEQYHYRRVKYKSGNIDEYLEPHKFDNWVDSTVKETYCTLCKRKVPNPNYSSQDYLNSIWDKEITSLTISGPTRGGQLYQSRIGGIASGATGMYVPSTRYTGDWGADGRLAILHEKELVLNKQDTENMLSAVNVIRDLSSTLNLPDLASKMNYLPNQISSSYFRDLSKNQEITQEVHIDASFPGVTAREEIEQAFGELALQAAQYINRYNQ